MTTSTTLTAPPAITAAAYCRISRDPEGLALGVDRQREDVLELALQRGMTIAPEHIFIDNDISASAKSKKVRPEYNKLKALVLDGTLDAVVFYSNSRLTRRMAELEEWIVLYDQTKVQLVSKVSGTDDLGTADGRMVARIKASVDTAESERLSERLSRAFEQRREAGKFSPGGHRPFGFIKAGATPEINEKEAEAIRHGAELLLAGGTVGSVIRDWEGRGLLPVRGGSWNRRSVHDIFNAGRIAGLVTHKGEVVCVGNFPAIIDRTTWEAVVVAMRHGDARAAGATARIHVLSGFVFCATCGTKMIVIKEGTKSHPSGSYSCTKAGQGCGGVSRNKLWVDEVVDGYITNAISSSEPVVEDAPVDHRLDVEVAELERRIADARQRHVEGRLDAEDFFPLLSDLRHRVNEIRKQQAEQLRDTTQKTALLDPMKVWKDGSLTAKRDLLSTFIKGIYVKPTGRIGRAPTPIESIEIVPT